MFYISMCNGKNMSLVKKVLLYNRYRFLLRWTNRQGNKLTDIHKFRQTPVWTFIGISPIPLPPPDHINENLARQLQSLCAKEWNVAPGWYRCNGNKSSLRFSGRPIWVCRRPGVMDWQPDSSMGRKGQLVARGKTEEKVHSQIQQ